jgi:nickel/cobalt transporter (NicO) family protein
MPVAAAGALARPASGRSALLPRIGLALLAVAIVAAVLALLFWLFAPAAPAPRVPARNPFGMGLREAAPAGSGFGAYILALQDSFFRTLYAGVTAFKASGEALWWLLFLGFAYGVFHAAGPGHGKAVIAAYLVASERALLKGILLSAAAALVQALVAIGLVTIGAAILGVRGAAMDAAARNIELASFAAVAALGAALTWRKAGKLLGVAALSRGLAPVAAPACDHAHLPPPEAMERVGRMREMAGLVLAAGIRPCTGAILVLVFALAQGLYAAGIAAVFAMALGTALTTGAIAVMAVFPKDLALRLAGGRGTTSALVLAGLELLASAFVLALGASLLLGMWGAGGGR